MRKIATIVFTLAVLVLWATIFSFAGDYKLPDTGIHKCYDARKEIPCPSPGQPFYGQDAQYNGPQPAYQDNGDGTVTDLNTGLVWQQGDGQNDSGGRNWQEACNYCEGLTLAGYSDWRLPNRRELMSIVDYGRCEPAIDTGYFQACRLPCWSSSACAYYSNLAWGVYSKGSVVGPSKTFGLSVRCVRYGP